jgi:nitroreductase
MGSDAKAGSHADLDQKKHGKAEVPVEKLFLWRWSPRAFSSKPVEMHQLKTIFSAGQWAASSFNEQPWRFVIGVKADQVWQRIFDSLVPSNQSWAKAAPVLYASFAKKTFSHNGAPNRVAQHDVGAASAQIAMQATALGLHAHGMAGFDAEKLKASFAVPEDFEPVACWALGYRGDPETLSEKQKQMEIQPRQRKPLSDWVFKDWNMAAF